MLMSSFSSFTFGLLLPGSAARLILRSPKLLVLSIIPTTLTLVLYFWVLSGIQTSIKGMLIHAFVSMGWDPSGWAVSVLLFLSSVLLILLGALTFSFTAGIASAPLNDFLAEQTESRANPPLIACPAPTLQMRIKMVGIDIIKTAVAGSIALLLMLLSWVPLLNFAIVIATLFLLTFQFVSYPQTRRGEGLGTSLHFIALHPFASLGFGAALAVLFAIPFVGILTLPCAVVGGTLLYARAQDEHQRIR